MNSNYSEHKLTPFTGCTFGSYYGDGFVQIPAGINYLTSFGNKCIIKHKPDDLLQVLADHFP